MFQTYVLIWCQNKSQSFTTSAILFSILLSWSIQQEKGKSKLALFFRGNHNPIDSNEIHIPNDDIIMMIP